MPYAHKVPIVALSIALLLATPACADSSIHQAAHNGDLARVTALIKAGVDPDARDSYGGTALHAAMFQPDIRIVELLIANGFDVNAVGPRNGYTPLHDAVWADNVAAARILLAHGARTDIRGKDGLSPYEKAIREQRQKMADLLRNARH